MQLPVTSLVMSLLSLVLLSALSRAAPSDLSQAPHSGGLSGDDGQYDDLAADSEMAKRLSNFVRIGRPSSFVRIGRGSSFVRIGKVYIYSSFFLDCTCTLHSSPQIIVSSVWWKTPKKRGEEGGGGGGGGGVIEHKSECLKKIPDNQSGHRYRDIF